MCTIYIGPIISVIKFEMPYAAAFGAPREAHSN